jgi:hypothetical protein
MPMPLGLGAVSAWVCLPSGDTYMEAQDLCAQEEFHLTKTLSRQQFRIIKPSSY